MIIDKHEVREVCFKEYPLVKYLRLTSTSWYSLVDTFNFTMLSFDQARSVEQDYQTMLKKGTW